MQLPFSAMFSMASRDRKGSPAARASAARGGWRPSPNRPISDDDAFARFGGAAAGFWSTSTRRGRALL